jgi:hypothetical protein
VSTVGVVSGTPDEASAAAAAAKAAAKAGGPVIPPGTRSVELVPAGETIELSFTVPLSLIQPALRQQSDLPNSAAVLSLHLLTETVRELAPTSAAAADAAAAAAAGASPLPLGAQQRQQDDQQQQTAEERALALAASIAGTDKARTHDARAHLPFTSEVRYVSCGEVVIPLHTVALASTDATEAAAAAAASASPSSSSSLGSTAAGATPLVVDALQRDVRTLLPGPTWHFASEDSRMLPSQAKALSRTTTLFTGTPPAQPWTPTPVLGVSAQDIERAFKAAGMKAKASSETGGLRLHTGLAGVQQSLELQRENARNLRRCAGEGAGAMSSVSAQAQEEDTDLAAAAEAAAAGAAGAAVPGALPVAPVRALVSCELSMAKPLIDRDSLVVEVAVEHVGLSLVDSGNASGDGVGEVLYVSVEGVSVSLNDSIATRAVELTVHLMQVDHQSSIVTAGPDSEAIVFGPSEDALASGKPFIHIGLSQTKTAADYPVQVFKYATVLVQEIEVTIDESLIWQLLSVVNDIMPRLVSEPDPTQYLLLDKRIMYESEGHSSAALFYFSLLHIQPLQLFITFRANPDLRAGSETMAFNPIQAVFNAASGVLGSIDAAPVCLNSLIVQDAYGDVATLLQPIVQFYVSQGIRQGYKILGSVEFLGNPVSLVSGVGAGVKDFFYAPAQGLVSSPKDFGTGLAKGSASLISSVTTGVFGAAAKITGSAGSGVAALTMDADFQAQRRARARRQVKHAGDGLFEGAKALGHGLFSGLKGIVADPLKGARQGGVGGFFKGLGKGLTGVVTKTASGAVDMVTTTLKGVGATFSLLTALGQDEIVRARRRLPRFLPTTGALAAFRERDALAQYCIHQVPPPAEQEDDAIDAFEAGSYLGSSLGRGIGKGLGLSDDGSGPSGGADDDLDSQDLVAVLRSFENDITGGSAERKDVPALAKKRDELISKLRRHRKKTMSEHVLLVFTLRTTSTDASGRAGSAHKGLPADADAADATMSDSDLLVIVTDVRVLVVYARAAARVLAREGCGSNDGAAKKYVRANVLLARLLDVYAEEIPSAHGHGGSPKTHVSLSVLAKGTARSADRHAGVRWFPAASLADARMCALRLRSALCGSRLIQATYGTRGAWADVTDAVAEQLALRPTGAVSLSGAPDDSDGGSGPAAAAVVPVRYPFETFCPSPWVRMLRRPRFAGYGQGGVPRSVLQEPPASLTRMLTPTEARLYAGEREWYNKLLARPGYLPERVKLLVLTYQRGSEIVVKTFIQGQTIVIV